MLSQHVESDREWKPSDCTVTEPATVKRAISAASVGNVAEWYDFGVYAFFEPVIQKVFFSNLSHPMGEIATFGLFAVAFLIRPLGGAFFGPLADRIGRNKVLAATMILMAVGTFAIGCIPSQESIGILAPLLLLAARLVQGFSTGGEYGSAMTFIAEYAPDRKRGFLGSWLEFGTFTGYLLGAIVVTTAHVALTEEQLLDWGWRLPFFLALPLGLIGLYLRSQLAETPAFAALERQAEEREKTQRATQTYRDVLVLWPYALVCMGLVLAWNVPNYMLTAYMPTYVTQTLPTMQGSGGMSATASQILQIVVMVIALLAIPLIGRLSDRFGRKPFALAGAVGLVVLALPMILLIRSQNQAAVFLGLLMMGLLLICFSATMPSTLPALFPTNIRATGLSIAFNVSVSLFAGTTSLVVGSLVAFTGDLNWPAYYLMIAGAIGTASILAIREPNGACMWGSAPAAASEAEARDLVARSNAASAGGTPVSLTPMPRQVA
ncbi:MHS family proline/betaine transporter-like MFS transporter [Methylorubrum rhodinum]|uniref:MHS family proline/betaine transporter-like MFS transporter n=1 Tax=Methylorubrum rhodinum TaxID=29428 RepID=A0A840ZJC5_9HYPH|nr:MFS transporter [Methylorubrum rhodinum]MBB5757047.1 MHS family proline/betaine transporter-like MFS transporter [Methylorubrum rhodinum]